MKKSYIKLIKKINPKVVLFNYKPTEVKALLNSICKEYKIPTVNLQHGIISEASVEMKTGRTNLDVFPDYLFSFGERLTDYNNTTYNETNIKYIGHPYLENKSKTEVLRPDFMKVNYKYILIVSQEVIGEQFANFTSELAEKLLEYSEYKIIFKYHPAEYHRDYKQLKKDNIIEMKNLEYDIYTIQKYSYVQVGVYSTGLYEGIIFNLPTVVISSLYGASDTISTLSFMRNGFYTVKNVDELVELIKSKKLKHPNEEDVDKIWKSNSYNNLLADIKEILNK